MQDQRLDYADGPVPSRRSRLSLWDSICLIVGIIIGASIYQTSPDIFQSSGSGGMGMAAWLLGGIVSLIGALCYAELATTYRTAGGDYTYLTRAYGSKMGFVFAWAELSVIRTGGSIAFMAYIFAKYATEFCDLGPQSKLIYALLGIIVLTFINAIGVRPGRVVQNVLTTANIVGLSSIAIIGLVWWLLPGKVAPAVQQTADNAPPSVELSFALTMVLVFYAYGGWNEAAFIAAEAKNPKKNVRRALILGTLLVTVIYLCVNLAYLGALGYDGVCKSKTIAADIFELPFGATGRKIISALIMFSSLGSIHGLLFTGMRLYGTFGRDHKLFAWLAGKQDPNHAHGALFAQAVFSIILITVVELAFHWRQALSEMAGMVGLQLNLDMQSETENIYKLVACTAPVFWFFFLLTGCSLFVLRWKEPAVERPFRVPLYPVLPFVFVASCAFMLYKSSAYALDQEPAEALIVAGLMFLGIPLGIMSGRARLKYQQSDFRYSLAPTTDALCPMPRDHYEVLGVSKSATADEISKAYRKLARQHHPDRNPGDKQAETRFKEIQNAYDVLSDPKKKAMYDQFGTDVPPGAPGAGFPGGGFQYGPGGPQQMDPEMAQEIFRRMFGGGGGGGFEDLFGSPTGRGRGRGRSRSQPQPPAETVEVEAHVPFLTAALGGTIGLRVGDRDIDVKVPAGFEDGKKLRVAGQGEYGEDIVVKVRVDPHAYFRREGKDILLDVPISIPEAVLGGKVEVPTVSGKRVTVKIPPGTSSGSRIRLPGMGAAGGDQYLVMKVVVPKGRPDDKTRELIEEYAELHPDDVRIDVPWR